MCVFHKIRDPDFEVKFLIFKPGFGVSLRKSGYRLGSEFPTPVKFGAIYQDTGIILFKDG